MAFRTSVLLILCLLNAAYVVANPSIHISIRQVYGFEIQESADAPSTADPKTSATTTSIPKTEDQTTVFGLCERPCIYGVCTSYNKCTCDPGWIGDQCESRSRDCTDYYKQGHNTSEPVEVFPYSCCPDESVSIICDQENDGGGWTIIQRRQEVDPRENFARPWTNYVEGFGQLDSEFWIGLKYMHKITTQAEYELRINLEDWEGNTRYASYKVFQVGSAESKYRLTISGYTGDAGNSMGYHNGAAFSTTDQYNGILSASGDIDRCAEHEEYGGGGGWWYGACLHVPYSALNGLPLKEAEGPSWQGIWWQQWLGADYSLRSVTMKIRPRERTA